MSRPTPLHQRYLGLVRDICKQQPLAYQWFEQVLEVALLWDHVVDGDPIEKAPAEAALEAAILRWVHNDWYVQNRASLTPVLTNCLSAWRFGGRVKAYDVYTELPCTIALLVGGHAAVNAYAPKIRALMEQERWQDTRRDHPPFLIVGLPRSRTAWFAAFLTEGEVHCHHELVRQCRKPDDYARLLLGTKAPIVGDADPSLPLYYGAVKDAIGPHRLVFILRDQAEAEKAHRTMLEEAGQEFAPLQSGWPRVLEAFERMRASCPDTLAYSYADLDKINVVQEIAEYCTGLPFNAARWRLFDELKVTALPAKIVRNSEVKP